MIEEMTSPPRADPRAHRLRGDPGGARADTRDRHAAAALRAGQPSHRRTGQGVAPGTLDVSVEDAFTYMRTYARANGEHLTDVARRLMTEPHTRFELVAAISEFATAPKQ